MSQITNTLFDRFSKENSLNIPQNKYFPIEISPSHRNEIFNLFQQVISKPKPFKEALDNYINTLLPIEKKLWGISECQYIWSENKLYLFNGEKDIQIITKRRKKIEISIDDLANHILQTNRRQLILTKQQKLICHFQDPNRDLLDSLYSTSKKEIATTICNHFYNKLEEKIPNKKISLSGKIDSAFEGQQLSSAIHLKGNFTFLIEEK